jgi:hypothetical protein
MFGSIIGAMLAHKQAIIAGIAIAGLVIYICQFLCPGRRPRKQLLRIPLLKRQLLRTPRHPVYQIAILPICRHIVTSHDMRH